MSEQHQHPPKARKAAHGRAVSAREAARLLGRNRATVSGWVAAGCPTVQTARRGAGVEWRIDLSALFDWHVKRAVSAERERLSAKHAAEVERLEAALAKSDAEPGEPISRSEALRRKAVADAVMRELDVQVREGDLASVEVLTDLNVHVLTGIRQRFLHLSGKIATQLAAEQTPTACQQIVDREVRDILTGIADSTVDDIIGGAVEETQELARRQIARRPL